MDGLRWLLLFFGVLVIAGVYLYSRRAKTTAEDAASDLARVEPTLQRDQVASEPDSSDALLSEPSIDIEPQKIVTLRVVAREKKAFNGEDLVLSMRGIGLRHGKFGIFHRYDGNDETRTIFSAASLVEPGSFDLANIKDQEIPGISLFLVLPGPVDGAESFDLMMAAARALSQSLNGELLDESGSTLSIQRERYLREEIIQFQHSILVA
ncbi:MAG: cell division protein ZipA [Woeseiaceae bacterium]